MSNWILKEGSRVWNMHSRVSGAYCIGDYGCHCHNDQLPVQKATGSLHIVVMEICPQLQSTCSEACMCLRWSWRGHENSSWSSSFNCMWGIGRVFDVICPKQIVTHWQIGMVNGPWLHASLICLSWGTQCYGLHLLFHRSWMNCLF
jgi:hypothetical protein